MGKVHINLEDAGEGTIACNIVYVGGWDPECKAHQAANMMITYFDTVADRIGEPEVVSSGPPPEEGFASNEQLAAVLAKERRWEADRAGTIDPLPTVSPVEMPAPTTGEPYDVPAVEVDAHNAEVIQVEAREVFVTDGGHSAGKTVLEPEVMPTIVPPHLVVGIPNGFVNDGIGRFHTGARPVDETGTEPKSEPS